MEAHSKFGVRVVSTIFYTLLIVLSQRSYGGFSSATPLFLAAYRGKLDVVRDILNMLIKRGGTAFRTQLETVCTPPGGQDTTQSTLACILGNRGGDRVFKNAGADGNTLLNLATAWGNSDAITYLRASCGVA